MYFIVYLLEPKQHVVIPSYWIYDEEGDLWDKFVNTGLNSSQKYLCYWASADNSNEGLGAPNDFVEANFDASRSARFPVNEGTYLCRIIKFKGERTSRNFLKSKLPQFFLLRFFLLQFFVCILRSQLRNGSKVLFGATICRSSSNL